MSTTLHAVPSITGVTAVSSSPSSYPSIPIQFYIQAFDCAFNMDLSGTLLKEDVTPIPDTDAQCVYNVSVNLMRSIFKVWLDDISIDFASDVSSNIRYYVFTDKWVNLDLNIANAYVNDGSISANSNKSLNLVKQDYLRYLASKLFGTHLGTDLFSNEQGLLNSVATQSHAAWVSQMNIMNSVAAKAVKIASLSDPSYSDTLQTDASLNTVDGSGNRYMNNADNKLSNISYHLMKMIADQDIGRMAVDFSNQTMDAQGLHSVPFREGDAIYFYSNISPAANQELLTGVPVIASRKYAMKLNLVSDATLALVGNVNPLPIEYTGTSTRINEFATGINPV